MKKETELIIYQNDFRNRKKDIQEDNALFTEELTQIQKIVNETYHNEIDRHKHVLRLLVLSNNLAYHLRGHISCALISNGLMLQTKMTMKQFALEKNGLVPLHALCEYMESLAFNTVDDTAVMVATYRI